MGQTIKGLFALCISTIVVHTVYTTVIRPKAIVMEALAAQGQPEMSRSLWIILKDFEQETCLILMFWAMFLIFDKMLHISKSSFLLDVDFLKDNDLSQPSIKAVLGELDTMRPSLSDAPLIRVLRSSLRRFLVAGDIHSASEVVDSECTALANKNEAENSMIRYLIWAVPSIGFIGTVRGIGEALSRADDALAGNISGMTGSLGVAFNSTLVALAISIVLMFLLHQLQRLQDDLTVSVNDYVQKRVLDRLSKASNN
jgi:biopolymer transport protein ExbB/TolQ